MPFLRPAPDRRAIRTPLLALAAACAGGVAIAAAVSPPRRPPGFLKDAPATSDAAGVRLLRGYASHTEVRTVSLPVDRYVSWADAAPLEDLLTGSKLVPAVTRTTMLRGTWNTVGARRRVALADGHFAAEQVLVHEDLPGGGHLFRYEVFGYTNYAKLGIDHAVGEFRTTPASSSSALIEWTYHYRPRSPLLRPIVRRFVEGVWAPYMASVLDRMVQLAERDG